MAITTGKVRASYVHLFQPRASDNGDDPKYSVTLLIPKSDTATINSIYAEIERAKQEGVQKAFNGSIPPQCRTPLYDGDGYRQSGEAFGEECRGCMVITASAKLPPVIVGLDMQDVLNPAELYSGCYIRANINFYAYNKNGNRGIGCGLNAVQKIEDGEPLGGRVSAEEAFGGANTYTGGYPSAQGTRQGYDAYPSAQGTRQGYDAYPSAQGTRQGYDAYPTAQGTRQGYDAYPTAQGTRRNLMTDPITGRPIQPGGVMGL